MGGYEVRKLALLLVALSLLILATVPASAQDGTILEIAGATADLSTLVDAVEAADQSLIDALSGPGPYTVFAPNNDAFARLDGYLQDNYGITLDDVLAEQELAVLRVGPGVEDVSVPELVDWTRGADLLVGVAEVEREELAVEGPDLVAVLSGPPILFSQLAAEHREVELSDLFEDALHNSRAN